MDIFISLQENLVNFKLKYVLIIIFSILLPILKFLRLFCYLKIALLLPNQLVK